MSLDITNEMDIMLAHRRGMQFARYVGIGLSEQTRFATAVSEICRNGLEYAVEAAIYFSVTKTLERCFLKAIIKDKGRGIADLPHILQRRPDEHRGRGVGLVFARKLVDVFQVTSSPRGTSVLLQMDVPIKNAVINRLVVQGWVKHLQSEPAINAYEELKIRNTQLVELSDQLKINSGVVEEQLKEIQLLNVKLSKSNDRMKEFTYAISHDLKTPLSNLKIASEYLQSNPQGEDLSSYKAILSRSVTRLDKTIHSLIEILDIQNPDKHIVRELDFAVVFEEIREEFELQIVESRAVIVADFSLAPKVHYIEGYLQSILRNLLSNSLKYKDAGRPLKIHVSTEKAAGGVCLSFTDTGSGMDLERIKERLFVPFTRFSGNSDGKGIGLYLIKGMVESNGGMVIVESNTGVGTTFKFTLVPYT